jgi:hypothetical protein
MRVFFKATEFLQRFEKLMGIERFSENMRRSRAAAKLSHQAIMGQLIEMPSAQHNDRNIRGRWRGAQFGQKVVRVPIRHEIIGYDDARFLLARHSVALHRIGGILPRYPLSWILHW